MHKTFVRVLLVVIAAAASAAAAVAQTVVTAKFADASVNLVVPKGHCVIPREDELGALHYKLQEDGNRDSNKVAILFADCREWAQRKANPALLLQNHGNYLFQLTQGQERMLPAAITRADVIQMYVDHEVKTGGGSQDITARLKQRLANASVPAPSIQGNVNLGLINWDKNAAYIGVGATAVYEGKPFRFVGVVGATSTRSVPATINLYGPATKGNPFRELLAKQKENVRQFVAANE